MYYAVVFLFKTFFFNVKPGNTAGRTGFCRIYSRWHQLPPKHWCPLHSIIAKGTAILISAFLSWYKPPAV